jgi:hypothetical protein
MRDQPIAIPHVVEHPSSLGRHVVVLTGAIESRLRRSIRC